MNLQDHIVMWQHADIQVADIRRAVVRRDNRPLDYRLPASCFLYGLRGGAQVGLDGVPYAAKPYSLLHGGKGARLTIAPTAPDFEYCMVLYKASIKSSAGANALCSGTRDNPFVMQYCVEPLHPLPLLHAIRKMEELWGMPTPMERLHVKTLFYQFVHELLHQMIGQDAVLARPDVAAQAIHYLETRYAEPITLEELAKELDYSVSHLSALFKNRTGASPIDYLLRKRMEKAAELLLTTSAPIREIAESVGYGDVYYFGRAFKKQFGTSPAHYRTLPSIRPRSENRPWTAVRSSIVLRGRRRYIDDESENHYQYKGVEKHIMFSSRSRLKLSPTLCLALLLGACGAPADSNEVPSPTPIPSEAAAPTPSPSSEPVVRSVEDDFGHKLAYPSNPERILAPYMEDALVTLGVTPVAKYEAAGTAQEHLEPWLGDLPGIDLMGGLSPEVVLGYEPDLILISSHFLPVEKYETIAKAAPTYLLQEGGGNWTDQLRKVADLLGKAEVAEQKLAEYDARLAEVKEQLGQAAADRTIAIVWPSDKECYLVGSEFLSGKLLYGELGLKAHELSGLTPDNFVVLSLEKLPELDADELFVITPEGQTEDQVRDLLAGLPLWSLLPAVAGNRVHHVSSGHWINSAYMANLAVVEDVTQALLEP